MTNTKFDIIDENLLTQLNTRVMLLTAFQSLSKFSETQNKFCKEILRVPIVSSTFISLTMLEVYSNYNYVVNKNTKIGLDYINESIDYYGVGVKEVIDKIPFLEDYVGEVMDSDIEDALNSEITLEGIREMIEILVHL